MQETSGWKKEVKKRVADFNQKKADQALKVQQESDKQRKFKRAVRIHNFRAAGKL